MSDEKLGYLIAKVEELGEDMKSLKTAHYALEKKVDLKFRTAEVVLNIFKFIGLGLIAVLSFKFGDLPGLWNSFFG